MGGVWGDCPLLMRSSSCWFHRLMNYQIGAELRQPTQDPKFSNHPHKIYHSDEAAARTEALYKVKHH